MRAYLTILDRDVDLVSYWVRHMLRIGADTFPLLVFDDSEFESQRVLSLVKGIVENEGGQHETVGLFKSVDFSAKRREAIIKEVHKDGEWAYFCDLDEFPQLSLEHVDEVTHQNTRRLVLGNWLDRVAEGGRLADVPEHGLLEDRYPMGAKTRQIWHMNSTSYTLANFAPISHHPFVCPIGKAELDKGNKIQCRVHHFRWQKNLVRRLTDRLQRIEQVGKSKTAWAINVRRTLNHVTQFDGLNPSLLHYIGRTLNV